MDTKINYVKHVFFLFLLISVSACTDSDDADDTPITDPMMDMEEPIDHEGIASDEVTVIQAWNDMILVIDRYALGMRPNACARALAYINLAAYETGLAVMDGYVSNDMRLDELDIDAPPSAESINIQVALNKTYAEVIGYFYGNRATEFNSDITSLETSLLDAASIDISDDMLARSIAWGEHVASSVIAYSETDREGMLQALAPQPQYYEPPTGIGFWTYSAEPERALFPYWESVRTFVVSADESSSIAPLEYSTDEESPYYQEMLEVYESNNAAREEDGEALWIAEFWSDDVETLMMSPPGRQISLARQLIDMADMNLSEALHMLVKVGFALNDAAVSTWDDKYDYMVMRPSVFIEDNIDPSYETNLFRLIPWPNPSFPAYPSGHSAFAGAAGGVFIEFFGNDITFTDMTHADRTEFRGMPRTFSSIEEFAEENAFSRIPLGVHMRMDCVEGLRLGYEIADGVNSYNLRE